MTQPVMLAIFIVLLALLVAAIVTVLLLLSRYRLLKRMPGERQILDHLQQGGYCELFFDNLPDSFMILDDKLTVITVNNTYCRITGRPKEEVIGKRPPFPGWPVKNWENIEDHAREVLKGNIRPFETAMYRKDGTHFPALFSVGELFSIDGRSYYSVSIRDISDRVRIEEALRASELKFRSQFMNLPIPLYIWQKQDGDFFLIDYNEAADKITGENMSGFLGYRASELYKDRPGILEDLRRCYDDRTSFQREMAYEYTTTERTKHLAVTYAFVPPDYILVHTEDRTARIEAREKLASSEAQLRTIVESLPFGFFMIGDDGRYSKVNSVLKREWGSDIVGKQPEEIAADPETLAIWQENNRRAFSGETVKGEVSFTIQGEKRYFYNIISPIRSDDGIKDILGVNIDITEQKRIERELHQSDVRLRLMAEQLPAILWSVDRDLRFTSSIGAGLAELGIEPDSVVGMTLFEYFQTDDPEFMPIAMHRKSLDGEPTTYEVEWDGRIWETHTEPLREPSGDIIGCLAIGLDVTVRKRAEEISTRYREQLRALASRLQEVREEESLKIARRIHDDLGQAMTGLRWDVIRMGRLMNQCMECSHLPQFDGMVNAISSDIDAVIKRVREIAVQLRPLILDDLGLVGAFEWQLVEFEKNTGIACEFDSNRFAEQDITVDTQCATVAFRILQEILTNVQRHAEADHVRVELWNEQDTVLFSVRDNGKGMALDSHRHMTSLGILGMRERALSIGGTVRIESSIGEGTTVFVTVPSSLANNNDGENQ